MPKRNFQTLFYGSGWFWTDFVEKTKIWHLLAYSDFLQTVKKKKCSISTDFFGVWHFFNYFRRQKSIQLLTAPHWYMRVWRVKIKVFKKLLFDNVSTKIGYFGPVNTIYCWVGWVWSEFMPFKETWNYQIFPILCYLGVKLTIVAKPQIPNNIPF